jgi:hypothetical protein
MTLKNLYATLIIIAILVIGVYAINAAIWILCKLFLAMLINPIGSIIVLFGLMALGVIADTLYKKWKA